MDIEAIQRKRRQQQKEAQAKADAAERRVQSNAVKTAVEDSGINGVRSASRLTEAIKANTDTVSEELKKTSDNIAEVISNQSADTSESLNSLLVATLMARDPQLIQVVKDFTLLLDKLAAANDNLANSPINDLPTINKQLAKALADFNKQESKEVDYTSKFDALESALKAIDLQPVVNVPKASIQLDLKPLASKLDEVKRAIDSNQVSFPDINFQDVIGGLKEVQSSIEGLSFPVPNYVLPFKDSNGKASQGLVDSSGNLQVTGLAAPTVIRNGKKTVTTAGTRVPLTASSTTCLAVIIRALSGNTGTIYVGDSTVASTNGYTLTPGESVGLAISDLANVYIDSSVNGEGVTFLGS